MNGSIVPFIVGDLAMTVGLLVYLVYLLVTGKGRD